MKPYDIVTSYLDNNKNIAYNKLLKVLIDAYELDTIWATRTLSLAKRYAGQGGFYEVVALFDNIVALAKGFPNE